MDYKVTINQLLDAANFAATNDFINTLERLKLQAADADALLAEVDENDIFYIGHYKELRNARNEALHMADYLYIAAMLATHLKENIHVIFQTLDKLDDEDRKRRKEIIDREEQRAISEKSNKLRKKPGNK